MTKAVVLFSGGMDSATVLFHALKHDSVDEILALAVPYGSKHNDVEVAAARRFVDWCVREGYSVSFRDVVLPDIFKGGHSALMADADTPMPALSYQEIAQGVGPSPTVVPFRNANLLAVATTIAVVENASYVYAGMHAEDARGWAYPDCTPEFLGPYAAVVYVGTYHKVQLRVPFQYVMKYEIVWLGARMGVPYHLTWSCYDPQYWTNGIIDEVRHCGKCPTCIERIEAFRFNRLIDPVEYAIHVNWDGCDEYVPN